MWNHSISSCREQDENINLTLNNPLMDTSTCFSIHVISEKGFGWCLKLSGKDISCSDSSCKLMISLNDIDSLSSNLFCAYLCLFSCQNNIRNQFLLFLSLISHKSGCYTKKRGLKIRLIIWWFTQCTLVQNATYLDQKFN